MPARHARFIVPIWIAILAMLMGAFAPTLSQVLQARDAQRWLEVCRSLAPRSLAAENPSGSDLPQQDHAKGHCPYCNLHVLALGLPPSAWHLFMPGLRFAAPAQPDAVAALPSLWHVAHARGPPDLV